MGYTHDTQENLDMVSWFHIDFFDLLEVLLLFIVLLFIVQLWCHLFYFTAIWKCKLCFDDKFAMSGIPDFKASTNQLTA